MTRTTNRSAASSLHFASLRLALCLIALALAAVAARAGEEAHPEYTLRTEGFGAPTTQWLGGGYARGPVRVLILYGDQVYHGGRELAELKRALALDAEYAICGRFMDPSTDAGRIRALLRDRTWDVVLTWASGKGHMAANNFALLPEEVQFDILSRVHDEGMGLLFRYFPHPPLVQDDRRLPVQTERVLSGIGFAGRAFRTGEYWRDLGVTPDAAAKQVFTAYGVGKGRIVNLDPRRLSVGNKRGLIGWQDAIDWSHDHRVDADYYMAELGRVLLWAAGREPEVAFLDTPPTLWTVDAAATDGAAFTYTLQVDGPARDITLSWRLRRLTGAVVATGEKTTPNATGKTDFAFALPALGSGRYYLDVFVDSPRGRETYGYSGVAVPAAYAVSVVPDGPGVEPGAELTGEIHLEAANGDAPALERLDVTLVDDEDRVLARQTVTARPDAPGRFAFDTTGCHRIRLAVEAEALVAGRRAGWGWATANVLHRRQDTFNVSLWGNSEGAYAHWSWRRRWREGVTTMLAKGGATEGNLTVWPWCGHFGGVVDGEEIDFNIRELASAEPVTEDAPRILQPVPWNDDEAFAPILALADRIWKRGQAQPVYVYNLYDEGPTGAMDMSEAGIADYRAWLRERYGDDLARLNAEWQSEYAAWDEVAPQSQGESEALETGSAARWADRKRFANVNFLRIIPGQFMERARQFDPQARVGFEGSGHFGIDIDAVLRHTGFWCPYEDVTSDLLRSNAPDDYIHGLWIGYTRSGDDLLRRAWNSVMDGAPSIWFWMLSGRGRFHGWVAMDDLPYPSRQALIDQCVLPLRRGLGDLLRRTPQPHDGVALYYSVETALAETPAGKDFGDPHEAAKSWKLLLEDCGRQWHYLTRERILDGALERDGVRLLILPLIQPLGAEEVAALTRFVENGGTLVADLRPGVLSGHCRVWDHGPAEALFGIQRTGTGEAKRIDGTAPLALGDVSIPVPFDNAVVDAALAPDGAAHATVADVPVLFVNPVGRGRAVLLNLQMDRYAKQRRTERSAATRTVVHALLEATGVAPAVRLQTTPGQDGPAPYIERATWRTGGLHLHAVHNHASEPVDLQAALPEAGYAFSLRDGMLGQTDAVPLQGLRKGHPAWFAVYPYDPGAPQATPDRTEAAGGETVVFTLAMPDVPADETATFAYETRLLDPDGAWVDVIPWSAHGPRGAAKVTVRFALDDTPGDWTLRVREVTTGHIAEAKVALRAP